MGLYSPGFTTIETADPAEIRSALAKDCQVRIPLARAVRNGEPFVKVPMVKVPVRPELAYTCLCSRRTPR